MTLTPAQRAVGAHILARDERTSAIRGLHDVILTARRLLADLDSPVVDFTTDRVRSLTDDAAAAARRLYARDGVQRATRILTGEPK